MKKVNLGSGPNCLPDWDNIDNSFNARLSKHPTLKNTLHYLKILPEQYYQNPWPSNIHTINIVKPLPYKSNSVDYIYTSHTLEHLEHYEAKETLKECYRILKPNAIIRIVLPDIEKMIIKYQKNQDINELLNRFFGYDRSEQTKNLSLFMKPFQHPPHKWMYTERTLSNILKELNFKDIKILSYTTGETPDISILDSPEETNLYIEAKK